MGRPSSLLLASFLVLLHGFGIGILWAVDDMEIPREALEKCKAATAFVDLGGGSSGSAFLVHSGGLFATNRHAVSELHGGATLNGATASLVLQAGDSRQKVVRAHVVAVSEEDDLALFKADEPVDSEPLHLAGSSSVTELSKVVLFGFPFGRMLSSSAGCPEISINAGHISSLHKFDGQLERIQLDAAANPGNSGGPLVDRNGEVIGVLVSGIRGAGVNFAIPAAKLNAMLQTTILSLRAPEIFCIAGKTVRF